MKTNGVWFAILITPLTVNASASEYLWFEGEWVHDYDATLTMNPNYQDVPEEITQEVFGHLRWSVRNGTYEVTDPRGNLREGPFAYFASPISDDSFELHSVETSNGAWPIVTRSTLGFCIAFKGSGHGQEGDMREADSAASHIDCYRPFAESVH